MKKFIKKVYNLFIPAKKREAIETKKAWTAYEAVNLNNFKNSEIIKKLTSNDICIDCGANVGDITSILAEKGAKVFAFEPDSNAFKKLETRLKSKTNVTLIKKGVYTENEKFKLYKSELSEYDKEFFSQSSSICSSKTNIKTTDYEEIEVIDLCAFIENLNQPIYLLKIDIEGAEFDILEKLIKMGLYNKIKYILVETHEESVPEIKEKSVLVRNLIKEKQIENINLNWV